MSGRGTKSEMRKSLIGLEKGRQIQRKIKKRIINWMGHVIKREGLMSAVLEGLVDRKMRRGRRTHHLLDDIKLADGYKEPKRTTQRREE